MIQAAERPPVAVTGVGIVSTAGRGAERTLAALRSGGRPPGPPRSIASELAERYPVFELPEGALDDPPVRLPGGRGRRGLRLALVAALDAYATDRASHAPVAPERLGVVVGATVGGMNYTELWMESQLGGTPGHVANRPAVRNLPLWETPQRLARTLGAEGPALAVSTACTGGSQAIATAAELLVGGVCDVVVAGGVDVLSRVTYHGFGSLGLLDRTRCRPFDASRAGLNMGEGAAFLVLRRGADARRAVGFLEGWACTADAHHMTAPRPDGRGLALAIRQTLERAGATALDVDWVHAHGTATPGNDGVEAQTVARALGSTDVPLSSTKHVFGHTLGAAGAISSVVALIACSAGYVPGNARIVEPDPACVGDLVGPDGLERSVRRVLVNAMGFGGTNCTLLLAGADR